MAITPDSFPGTREEEELRLDDAAADPSDERAIRYYGSRFRLKDANGVHDDTDVRVSSNDTTPGSLVNKLTGDGIAFAQVNDGGDEDLKLSLSTSEPGAHLFSISPGSMLTSGTSAKVIANDFAAIEFGQSKTGFASYSMFWRRGPASNVSLNIKFILKQTGTGSNVRIAAQIKARATGEDSSTAFDVSSFSAVAVTTTTIGEIFSATISLSPTVFANGDAVAVAVGRDGGNELGVGTDDDFGKAIQIIAIEFEVP